MFQEFLTQTHHDRVNTNIQNDVNERRTTILPHKNVVRQIFPPKKSSVYTCRLETSYEDFLSYYGSENYTNILIVLKMTQLKE